MQCVVIWIDSRAILVTFVSQFGSVLCHCVVRVERLQILFKWFNLDSYYPRPDSMYNCALSQSSHVDCQTLICVNPCQTWIRFRLIELVSMHLIMLMRLEPREVW